MHRWLVGWIGSPPLPQAPQLTVPPAAAPVPLPSDVPDAQPPATPPAAAAAGGVAAASTGTAGVYVIQVGTFRDADRAARLVAQLTSLQFEARDVAVTLGSRGAWREVLIGRYRTRRPPRATCGASSSRPVSRMRG